MEPYTNKAVKAGFHYLLVLSVSCVFIAYMSCGYSSYLRMHRFQPFAYPMSNSLFRDEANFWQQANLLLKSNTLLKSLKSTTASRSMPAYTVLVGATDPSNRVHIRTLRSTCIHQRIYQINQNYPIRSLCVHPSLV